MCTSSFYLTLAKCDIDSRIFSDISWFQHLIVSNGLLSVWIYPYFRFIFGILDTQELIIKGSTPLVWNSKSDSVIDFLNISSLEFWKKELKWFFFFDDNDASSGISVNSVKQCGLECERIILRSKIIQRNLNKWWFIGFMITRVDIYPCGFIQDQNRLIFEKDILFGNSISTPWLGAYCSSLLQSSYLIIRNPETNLIILFEFIGLILLFAIDLDLSCSKHLINSSKWCIRKIFFQKFIHSLWSVRGRWNRNFLHENYWRIAKSSAVLVVICGIFTVLLRWNP